MEQIKTDKNLIIDELIAILLLLKDNQSERNNSAAMKSLPEMLTIKECCEAVPGVSEYMVRTLIWEGKIQHVRSGVGKRGKILVNKDSLFKYFTENQGAN